MAGSTVGLKTAGRDLRSMLEKTGYNIKKLENVEKLDIIELIRNQLEEKLEMRGTTRLTLQELVSFLRFKGMALESGGPRDAMIKLDELRWRERARLGKHVSPKEEREIFEDALALIPDSEIYDVFEAAAGAAREATPSDTGALAIHGASITRSHTVPDDSESQGPTKRRRIEDGSAVAVAPAADPTMPRDPRSDGTAVEDAVGSVPEAAAAKAVPLSIKDEDPVVQAREERILALIDADAIQQHLPALGVALEDQKDALTQIRGIGPWIEKRLNRIRIYSFQQLAKLTPAIRKDVAKAIRFFPGRIEHDNWVFQAERLAAGKGWILNPTFKRSGVSGTIRVDGEPYERELIDIAQHFGKDGTCLDEEHAECLWFSAMDGRQITQLERKTLDYIMKSFKFSEPALTALRSKLA